MWDLSATSDCSSALSFTSQTLHSINSTKLYVDLPEYLSPCKIAGDSRPDIILSTAGHVLHIIELTVDFKIKQ